MTDTDKPKVSVCIPTYKRANILPDILKYVLSQTFKNFEVFISDDDSPDNTGEVIAGFNDPRIRYSKNSNNLGVIGNWNYTIKHARGEYVFKLDDDDYIHPTFLEKTVSLLEKYKNVGSVYTGFYYAKDYNGGWISEVVDNTGFKKDYINGIDYIKSYLLHTSIHGLHHSSVVFRYSVAKEIGFFEKAKNDVMFSLALASKADVGYVRQPLFYYVQHQDSRASYAEGEGGRKKFYHFDPTRLVEDFFDIDFIRSNADLMKIKDDVLKRERKVKSILHLFMSRKAFGLIQHLKISLELVKKDKRLLMSPLFSICLIFTILFPKNFGESVTYMYKSKSIFKKLNSIIFPRNR